MRIGVDLDNTIIRYDALFRRLAAEQGLLPDDGAGSKKALRDALRRLPNGEQRWTDLQALVYGPRILGAEPFPGVEDLFRRCRELGLSLCVVSHKTEFAASDPDHRTNLREAALSWLEAKGFFAPESGLRREDVHFTATREDKTARIAALGCDLFVDDLLEVFEEPGFPAATARVLFAPAEADRPAAFDGAVCSHWGAVLACVEERHALRSLLPLVERELGPAQGPALLLGGGRNSRVWKLTLGGREAALKSYHTRQRLDTEFAAYAFLRGQGLTCVPEPLLARPEERFAVYGFVHGAHVRAGAVQARDVDDFIRLALELKRLSRLPEARALAPAAEACFSLEAVLANIRARLDRLQGRTRNSGLEPDLAAFLEQGFAPALGRLGARAQEIYAALDWKPGTELPADLRSLSPSDFGFHNALRTDAGMVFLDFEYFGWDDPAKMLADFLLHPGMGVGEAARQAIARGVLEGLDDPLLPARLSALAPLFGLKWCMILLNEFLAEDFARRAFAGEARDREAVLGQQLDKARAMLTQARELGETGGSSCGHACHH